MLSGVGFVHQSFGLVGWGWSVEFVHERSGLVGWGWSIVVSACALVDRSLCVCVWSW